LFKSRAHKHIIEARKRLYIPLPKLPE
jgi:hypothetical protein